MLLRSTNWSGAGGLRRVHQQEDAVDHREDALDLAAEVGVAWVSTMLMRTSFQSPRRSSRRW
jgi:sugar phosphate isomerase/epimerase